MNRYRLTDKELGEVLEIARLAPSAHNTQPWSVKRIGDGIKITVDEEHALDPGDPVGRQTIMGLGIFVEAFSLAAESIGLDTGEVKFFNNEAFINCRKNKQSKTNKTDLLKSRATDRSVYSKIKLDDNLKETIEKSWQGKRAKVWFTEEKKFITRLARLTSQGISLALTNPQFRSELSRYLLRPWSRKKRGISVSSLYIPWFLALLQPELLRIGISSGQEAKLEEKRWLSASAVILITSEGDIHSDWFAAGRAYLRVSLAVEQAGLSQATSAATVEASTFHEDIEKMLGTNQRLQAVIRIGKGVKKRRYSPRVAPSELVT